MGYKEPKLNPQIAPTVRAEHHNCLDVHFVLVTPKSINTPSNVTNTTSNKGIKLADSANTIKNRNYNKRNPWAAKYFSIRDRCISNKKSEYYKKGILCLLEMKDVKEAWFRDKAYLLDCPSIDRIDPKGNYEPSNIRFIELRENCGRHLREKTHCPKGHPYNKENTYRYKTSRICLTCLTARNRENSRTKKYRKTEFPKFLKVHSPKQAFRLWIEYKGKNGRISADLFDMFGGSKSKLYIDWCHQERFLKLTKGE